jgi:hypothetical protein
MFDDPVCFCVRDLVLGWLYVWIIIVLPFREMIKRGVWRKTDSVGRMIL